jgi:uncharacterized protein
MKLDFDEHENKLIITSYSTRGITIGGRVLVEPFVACGNEIYFDRLPSNLSDFGITHIKNLVALKQNIILIGTGATQVLLDDSVLCVAYEAGIGVEVMTTPAACRSYNVLAGENRALLGAFYML